MISPEASGPREWVYGLRGEEHAHARLLGLGGHASHVVGEPPTQHQLDFNGVVTCAVDVIRDLVGRDVRLVFAPTIGALPVRGVPDELHGLALALLLHARDALPEGGRLRISTARVAAIRTQPCAGPWVRLQVHDSSAALCASEPLPLSEHAHGVMARHGGLLRMATLRDQRARPVGHTLEAFLPSVA